MTSLTRDAAAERARLVTVEDYELRLDFTQGDQHFDSVSTVRFTCASPGAETFVEVAPHLLRSAVLNGTPVDLDSAYDPTARRIALAGLRERNELVVDAVMEYSHDGEGLHRHVDPADGLAYLYAMSFLDAAPRWFACFDQPDLKAPVRIELQCPADWLVAGNGPAHEVEPGRWRIESGGVLATYFTTLVCGPYHRLRDSHDGIALSLLVRRSLAEHLDRDAAELFAHTKHCFDELHRLFGYRYPWGEYCQAFVPEFNAGAMENPGCVTFRDQMIFRSRATDADHADRAVTIAHEMAHMWFGDLVTMRWWDDLWLNESFAEYLGHRVCGEQSWAAFGIERKSWGFAADRRPSTHPVAGNGAADTASALTEFDGISYAKGASVLRQLATHLGDEVFLRGLRDHIAAHAHGNAQFADLTAAWSAAGAQDLDAWATAWLTTSGVDELAAEDGAIVRRDALGVSRTHAIAVAELDAAGGEQRRRRVLVAAERTPLEVGDPRHVLLDAADETWAKIVLPREAWAAMGGVLPGIADVRSRVVLWNALQLAVADADIDPMQAVGLTVAALPAETHDAVIERVGDWARRTLADCYLPDAAGATARTRLADAMRPVLEVADPGSSRQLAAARVFVAATFDTGELGRWLHGEMLPDGLVIDTDLRWAVLGRLVQLDAASAAEIDSAEAADHSSQGAVHAARCRAARPDAGAKADAWRVLMTDPVRPNYELYAMAEGFWQPNQRELTAPFVARYFEEIGATAALRSGWIVDRLSLLSYPRDAVARSTVEATQRLLADVGLDSGIRRSATDAGDDLRRALAARDRFA